MKVATVSEMRALEAHAAAVGLSYDQMMESAGRGAAEALRAHWPPAEWPSVLVLVGPGNNGGDGLVVARTLAGWGYRVLAYVAQGRPARDPNMPLALEAGVEVLAAEADGDRARLRAACGAADVVVDAVLGTGASRPIEGVVADVLRDVREVVGDRRGRRAAPPALVDPCALPAGRAAAPRPAVLAIDLPSGLNADTGALDPLAIAADVTVTFACAKPGHFMFPGAGAVGELLVVDIGIPATDSDPLRTTLLEAVWAAGALPERPLSAHKGTFGRALIVAGSVNYTGAACLAGAAAARVGAGLVTLAVGPTVRQVAANLLPEATFVVLPESLGALTEAGAGLIAREARTSEALLVGCGLGREPGTVALVHALLEGRQPPRGDRIGFAHAAPEAKSAPRQIPMVVDADGLNALAERPGWAQRAACPLVLTPHPGEMARLLGISVSDVNRDRFAVARQAAAGTSAVVVLKGAHTLVASPDGRVAVSPFAVPALATAGTGDVLAGTIVGLLAQGMDRFDAACLGVYLHGAAGVMAQADTGTAGVLAGDLAPLLPLVMRRLRRE